MLKHRKYKNPPAIEVLFEVFFSETQSNLTLFGDFYQKIKSDYSRQEQLRSVGLEMNFTQENVQTKQINRGNMMRFSKEDNFELVQVSENLLTVNKLKPYLGYEHFRKNVEKVLQPYIELAKPTYSERIGMRYIDRIQIPEDSFELDKYFNFSLNFANEEFSKINGISFKVQLTPKHKEHQLFVTLNSVVSSEEGKSEFILDTYDILLLQKETDENYILSVLDEAHENIEYIFESVITDSARELFEEIK
jgi:uncharacterized protein (TIGR04255 family)